MVHGKIKIVFSTYNRYIEINNGRLCVVNVYQDVTSTRT